MKYRIMLALCGCTLALTSCLKDDKDGIDYTAWNNENEAWIQQQMQRTDDSGNPYYEQIVPVWAPGTYVLMHWHVRTPEAERILPMSNSTVDVKYEGRLLDGTVFDNSYKQVQYGDSIYRTKPSSNIVGFHAALTQMAPGDSVTVVMPCNAAYGMSGSGSKIKPYSALEYDIKMKRIYKYDSN